MSDFPAAIVSRYPGQFRYHETLGSLARCMSNVRLGLSGRRQVPSVQARSSDFVDLITAQ
jgi:hypothetical protein